MNKLIVSFALVFCGILTLPIQAQSTLSSQESIKQIFSRQKLYNLEYPEEKSYLHTDKSFYYVGDTVWFKNYTVFAAGFTPDTLNSTLYVDLVDQDGKVIREVNVRLRQGLGHGQIAVSDTALSPGHYMLRAYTSWMRNFKEEPLYSKVFSLYNRPRTQLHWLLDQQVVPSEVGDSLKVSFTLTDAQYQTLSEQPVEYWFRWSSQMRGVRGSLATDKAGRGAFILVLPKSRANQTGTLSLVTGTQKDPIVSDFPVTLNLPEVHADFLPEGGYQVQGVPSRVAFKITDENGRGVRASGDILDEQSNIVAQFYTYYEGMGAFSFTPQRGKSYRSRVISGVKDTLIQPLPVAIPEGTVLEVQTALVPDSIILVVKRSGASMSEPLGMLIQSSNRPVSQSVLPGGRSMMRFSFPRTLFPAGVSQITLFNHQGVPLAERLVFSNHYQGLRFGVVPSKSIYQPREKVELNLKATDAMGRPVQGEFSVSVTDVEQVPDTILKDNNILTHMLLSSELKGFIAQPGYYFRDTTMRRRLALEYLLMTQGWRRYRWESALKKDSLGYEFEPGIPIAGQVKNITFGTPLRDFTVTMLMGSPVDSVMSNHPSQPVKWGWEVPKTGLLGTDTTVLEYVRGTNLKAYSVTKADEQGRFSFYTRMTGEQTVVLQTQRASGPIEKRIDIRDMSDLAALPFGALYEGRPGEKEAFMKEQQRKLFRTSAEQRQKQDLFSSEMKRLYGDVAWSLMLQEVEVSTPKSVREFADKKASVTVLMQEQVNFMRNKYNFALSPAGSEDSVNVTWLEAAYPTEVRRTGSGGLLWKGRKMASVFVDKNVRADARPGDNCYERYMILDTLNYAGVQALKDALWEFAPRLSYVIDSAYTAALDYNGRPPVYVLYFPYPDNRCESQNIGVRVLLSKGYDGPKEFYSPNYSKPQSYDAKTLDYRDVLLWAPVVRTDTQGKAKLEFYNDDRAKTLRVDVQGMTSKGVLGAGLTEIKVR